MRVASLTKDVSEIIDELGSPKRGAAGDGARVAYHAPCTLLHGQKIDTLPERLLEQAGFVVMPVKEKHFCCGSAAFTTLSSLRSPTCSKRDDSRHSKTCPSSLLRLETSAASVSFNPAETPVVHMIELLDWALGGSKPPLIK